jgi:hypothetical protein
VSGLGGFALLVGAVSYTLAWFGFAAFGRDPLAPYWLPFHLLVIFGSIGIAAGLPALHGAQAHGAGVLGVVATAMLFVGFLLAGVARQSVEAFAQPLLGTVPPASGLLVMIAGPLLFVGMVALGVAIVRAGVFPVWTGVGLVVAALAGAFAAYVPLPHALRWSVASLASLVLAYLGWLLLFDRRG